MSRVLLVLNPGIGREVRVIDENEQVIETTSLKWSQGKRSLEVAHEKAVQYGAECIEPVLG